MKNTEVSKVSNTEQNSFMTAIKDLENKMENMFSRLWDKPFHDEGISDFFNQSLLTDMPRIDVVDKDKEISVKAELPGIEKKDIDVSIADRRLVIKAKTCHEEKEEDGDYLKQEISKKEFYRSILLPSEVDDSKVKTSFKNGVLKLTIPKQKNAHRKRIEIT